MLQRNVYSFKEQLVYLFSRTRLIRYNNLFYISSIRLYELILFLFITNNCSFSTIQNNYLFTVYIRRRNETIYTYYLINDHSIINESPMNIMKLLVCFRDQMLLPWLTLVQYSYGSELNLTINECRGHLI